MPGLERYRKLGLCLACGKPPAPGRKKCADCLAKFHTGHKVWRNRMKSEGRCIGCGKPNDLHPLVFCTTCKTKYKSTRVANRLKAFNAYGGPVCACCGETIIEFLTFDHMDNNGANHRREIRSTPKLKTRSGRAGKAKANGQGVDIVPWLIQNNFPPGFQVLCMNCNFAKGRHGACPHQKLKD